MSDPQTAPDVEPQPESRSDAVTAADVVQLYRLSLARDPETDTHAIAATSNGKMDQLRSTFGSMEFQINVIDRVLAGRGLLRAGYEGGPGEAVVTWAAEGLPLTSEGAAAVMRCAKSWAGFYGALFNDADFAVGLGSSDVFDQRFLLALADVAAHPARYTVEGAMEEVSGRTLRGWALDLAEVDRPLRLELYADDAFLTADASWIFRRDLQDRFGGAGRYGFSLDVPPSVGGGEQTVMLELKVVDGPSLGRTRYLQTAPPLGEFASLSRQVAEIGENLRRVEAALQVAAHRLTFAAEDYPAYAAAYYADPLTTAPDGAALGAASSDPFFSVVLDGVGADPAALEAAVWSIARQSFKAWRLSLVCLAGDQAMGARDLQNRIGWAGGDFELLVGETAADASKLTAEALNLTPEPAVVLLAAGAVLAPDALDRLAIALKGGAAAVYGDDDAIELLPGADVRRFSPRFKGAFDPDLLLQTPYVGPLLAFDAAAVREAGGAPTDAGSSLGSELVLLVAEAGGRVEHLPRVISSVMESSPLLADWQTVVTRRLALSEPQASVEPDIDLLGATVSGALRIRRPYLREGATASVIIPTRDRLDLLRPCLDSLFAGQERGGFPVQFLIVDNGSEEDETRAYLAEIAGREHCVVLPAPGTFNWSLLNNLAAAEATSDVLIFLNNDTMALTGEAADDWAGALVEQAMRPDVGAVGARLLYEDGTIQHAGMVLRPTASFAAHEGVGERGGDAGYLGRHALVRTVSAVTGACLATRRNVFRSLGGFDTAHLAVEGNDVDYCLRAAAAGLKTIYEPHAALYHLESKSRGFNDDPAKRAQSDVALALLRARWEKRFGNDPGYNSHFDRQARPFTRLRQPPS